MFATPGIIGGSTASVFSTVSNSSSQLTISSLFSLYAWQSGTTKIVRIPSGVTLGSTDSALPALVTGTNMGGQLIIQNYGSIQGAGGDANSGAGGTAFRADQNLGSNFIFQNYGTIYGGGGGGGVGGRGGGGSYTSPITVTEGPYYSLTSPNFYYWVDHSHDGSGGSSTEGTVVWNGTGITAPFGGSSFVNGIYTYHKGTFVTSNSSSNDQGGSNSYAYYYVSRTYASTQTNYTSGGAGGSGGVGGGYNHNASAGTAGSAGGTNAGTGGTGGTGGGWGMAGETGATGAAGNYTSGVTGTAGGRGGYSIQNLSYFTFYNYGSIIGSTYN